MRLLPVRSTGNNLKIANLPIFWIGFQDLPWGVLHFRGVSFAALTSKNTDLTKSIPNEAPNSPGI